LVPPAAESEADLAWRFNAEVPAAAARAAAALDIPLVHSRRCASSPISVVDRHTPEILRV